MHRTFLKHAAYISAVLLIGQIPIHEITLGQFFLRQIQRAVSRAGGEIQKTKLVATLGKELRDLSAADDAPRRARLPSFETEEAPADPEEMTPADKEALRRLLE